MVTFTGDKQTGWLIQNRGWQRGIYNTKKKIPTNNMAPFYHVSIWA